MSVRSFGILAIALFCISRPLSSQGREPCHTDVLARTERNVGKLSEDGFRLFFNALDPSCKGNSRFMGWANDLLSRTLESQPELFIACFDSLSRVTQRMILDELAAPAHEGLDPGRTWNIVRDSPGPSESKERILQALTKASCRCDPKVIQ